ncbi:MAG: guanylate kinase [Desulfovibrionales bacterium]
MSSRRSGVALVLSAPSGTGKSTLCNMLIKEFPRFSFSISYTTRDPREGERDGQDYHFVTKRDFLSRIDQGFFAEWAQVHGNYYGTPLGATRSILTQGKDLLFDIDVQGAFQLKESMGQGCFVFLFPPSLAELKRRLACRGSEDSKVLDTRIKNAREEIKKANFFDFWIVNDDLDRAYDRLRAVYLAEQSRACLQPSLMKQILSTWEE